VHGTFTINPDLSDDNKIGLFKGKSFPAWVRFSSDNDPSDSDSKTSLGIGIKLFGVSGTKTLDIEKDATTHDILLQNHDVFFVDTAFDMRKWAQAKVNGERVDPKTERRRANLIKSVTSVLDSTYWSIIPYVFGDKKYVKYKLEPENMPHAIPIDDLTDDPNRLRQELRRRLLTGDAAFKFYLHFNVSSDKTPLDKATVRWEESGNAPVFVARLTIPRQDIDAKGQAAYGENLAFNPWHALPEHKPFGSIAEARKIVYEASAERRRNVNGIPIAEPRSPRKI
jgi:catalase